MLNNHIENYCTGCGLCNSVRNIKLAEDEAGFVHPIDLQDDDKRFLNKICMISGEYWKKLKKYEVWGKCVDTPYYAFSSNQEIRYKASSGGVISECAIYLLEEGLVDGIIHSCVSEESVIATKTVCSTSKDEVLKRCGSRYAISHPLDSIQEYLKSEKRYAFIGKPCDVMVLRNFARIDNRVDEKIPYMISFMCAGVPSKKAGVDLLNRLGTTEDDCRNLVYRGNGWPGYTTAVDKNGKVMQMTYGQSWGEILGRDVARNCRLCMDGIGEAADIACGDGWYITNGKPDFSENEGRSIVFPRTQKGKNILDGMYEERRIRKEVVEDVYRELKIIQNYQFTRRTTMLQKIDALKLMGKNVPHYPKKLMKILGKNASVKGKIRIFLGTCNRIIKKKI